MALAPCLLPAQLIRQVLGRREAEASGAQLLVAAFVLASHTHPTERRIKFWLEGLRDTQLELRGQVKLHLYWEPSSADSSPNVLAFMPLCRQVQARLRKPTEVATLRGRQANTMGP